MIYTVVVLIMRLLFVIYTVVVLIVRLLVVIYTLVVLIVRLLVVIYTVVVLIVRLLVVIYTVVVLIVRLLVVIHTVVVLIVPLLVVIQNNKRRTVLVRWIGGRSCPGANLYVATWVSGRLLAAKRRPCATGDQTQVLRNPAQQRACLSRASSPTSTAPASRR